MSIYPCKKCGFKFVFLALLIAHEGVRSLMRALTDLLVLGLGCLVLAGLFIGVAVVL